jgi:Fe-S cluster biogenesis protein NfuA
MGLNGHDFGNLLQRLEGLLREVERYADPAAQAHTRGIVQALLDLHGYALERLLGHVQTGDGQGQETLEACLGDDAVSGLLLLHGLHPHDYATRVREALRQISSRLESHGGRAELLDAREGVVRLRIEQNGHACPSSSAALKQAIEEAIFARAPETTCIEVEGTLAATADANRVALPVLA